MECQEALSKDRTPQKGTRPCGHSTDQLLVFDGHLKHQPPPWQQPLPPSDFLSDREEQSSCRASQVVVEACHLHIRGAMKRCPQWCYRS